MKNLWTTLLLLPAAALSGAAYAEEMPGPVVKKTVVQYVCQQGKKVKVTYGFNKQKLPVYASAHINGKTRRMPINLYRSDDVTTTFGDEKSFSLGAEHMTLNNHRRQSVMITSPSQEIVYKGCMPRKR
ncbi:MULTISPECIES: adhesin [Neisseria]|uniref:ACP-like domain-containing protein n=1 Tax=Neisseria musculi TaxID=1815583 RepID=A0A7H1MEK6_9NEIS|nr:MULTISPECIES: adhesin [Neisseria]MBF0804038.1 adhesin [Neisseria sp. 19428wB4_WF04]QNT60071.1 hypothetical protein H7A79_0052 [Neisseria musculi]TFU43241.1 adhesin [Neisseria sp. WF04]